MGGTPSSTGSMSVGSIVDTDMTQTYPTLSAWNPSYSYPGPSETAAYSQDYSFDGPSTTEASPMLSSDGWNSPNSESQPFHLQTKPYISTYGKPVVSYASEMQSPPTSAPMAAAGIWTPSEGYLYPSEGLGIEFTSQGPPPVGIFKTLRELKGMESLTWTL